MMTDPISDMLARIRNAGIAKHATMTCPTSKLKLAVARVMQEAGFLADVREEERDGHRLLLLGLRYRDDGAALIAGMRRVSKPSRRVYVRRSGVHKVRNGLGVAVVSTPKGVMSDAAARDQGVGGEILCEVW